MFLIAKIDNGKGLICFSHWTFTKLEIKILI